MTHWEAVPFAARFFSTFFFMFVFVWLGGLVLFNRYGDCDNFGEAVFGAVIDLVFLAFICAVAAIQL